MFDLSWGEVLMVGAVALIVIGPKDLPKALRTVGQMAGKMRRMASEFQGQFNEAMREAELDEIRKQVASVNDAASFNPIDTIRSELKSSIESKPAAPATDTSAYKGTEVAADSSAAQSATPAADPLYALPPPPVAPVGDPAAAFASAPAAASPEPVTHQGPTAGTEAKTESAKA